MERVGWKSLIRYFITPSQKSHYDSNSPVCWRSCGNHKANRYHIFGGWLTVIKNCWRGTHNPLQDIFKCVKPLESKILFFLGHITYECLKSDINLMNIQLKRLTRKWLSLKCSAIKTWMKITMDKYKMERVTSINWENLLHIGKNVP